MKARICFLNAMQREFLLRTLDCEATSKYLQGLGKEITFPEALDFWEMGDEIRGEAVNSHLREFQEQITSIRSLLMGGTEFTLGSGRVIQLRDASLIRDVDAHLRSLFNRSRLNVLRARKEWKEYA